MGGLQGERRGRSDAIGQRLLGHSGEELRGICCCSWRAGGRERCVRSGMARSSLASTGATGILAEERAASSTYEERAPATAKNTCVSAPANTAMIHASFSHVRGLPPSSSDATRSCHVGVPGDHSQSAVAARPARPSSDSQESSSTASRRYGWSKKASHELATIDTENPKVVSIADTRSLGSAAAVRATTGYQAGQHDWAVEVEVCSNWSYVGFVSEAWTGKSSPIGRGPQSWAIASNGLAYDCGSEVTRVDAFTNGSVVAFYVDLDAGSADVVVDGKEFRRVFSRLPALLFPAVSNCRSAAKYVLVMSSGTAH